MGFISRYVREQKRYTKNEIKSLFSFSESEVESFIRRLKSFGIMKAVKNTVGQRDLSDLSDADVEITDDAGESSECFYVFTYVGVLTVGDRVVKCFPKYITLNNAPDAEMKQVIRVLRRYGSKEQIVNLYNGDGQSSSFNILAVMLFLLEDYHQYGAYTASEDIIEVNGEGPILWGQTIDNGFALPPIEEFEKAITPRTRAIMVCNPNNPTGYLYTKEELQSLAQLAKKHDLFLFADEVYREFCYDGKKHFSVMELDEISNNVILLDSVSKRYSACGARVGVIISKNKEVMTAALRMGQARLCPPYFGQIFAEAAIDTPQEYFDKVAAEYDSRRRTLVNAVNQIPGCRCPMPTGAFYSIIEMPIDDSDKFCEWLLKDFTYNGATVMLAPATGF